MLINKTCVNAELIFSPKFQWLVRRQGHQLWVVYVALQLLQHSQDGEPIAANQIDMIAMFSGLDIGQVERALELLIEHQLITFDKAGFSNPSVVEDLQRVTKRREIYRANGKKGGQSRAHKSDPEENQTLSSNSLASVLNTELLNTEDLNKDLNKIVKENYKELPDHKYLKLTEEDYQKLELRLGDKLPRALEILDCYIANNPKGRKYKDHYRAIIGWVEKKVLEEENLRPKGAQAPKSFIERNHESKVSRLQNALLKVHAGGAK